VADCTRCPDLEAQIWRLNELVEFLDAREERAGILQFLAGLSKKEAERIAHERTKEVFQNGLFDTKTD
jgi:hypothetical protein